MIARHQGPREWLGWLANSRSFAQSTISALLLLLLALGSAVTSFAADQETLPEYEIKAGFFFNFTRFVEWPEDAFATPTSPIVACVMGETPLTDLVNEMTEGKVVNGRAISINQVKPADDLRRCNLLFISEAAEHRTGEILARLRKTHTLSVGENPGFSLAGGMINFAILDNKIKLEINLDETTRAGLKVNSKLIAVARLVSSHSAAEEK